MIRVIASVGSKITHSEIAGALRTFYQQNPLEDPDTSSMAMHCEAQKR